MVQQPFVGSVAANQQQQVTQQQVANNMNNVPQYHSPQANYYQQQQVAQFMGPRINGLPTNGIGGLQSVNGNGSSNPMVGQSQQQYSGSQQNSPAGQAQQQIESLYNGVQQNGRAAPIYAPKPIAYFSQSLSQLQQQAPIYQSAQTAQRTAQANYFPQQVSPANQLSVRQLNGQQPATTSQLPQPQQPQPPQTQLFLSYQQQLNLASQSQFAGREQLVQQQQPPPIPAPQHQHVDVRWNSSAQQQQLDGQQSRLLGAELMANGHLQSADYTSGERVARSRHRLAPTSDRDSVSTLSRFTSGGHLIDERRSVTMRSQYTNNQSASRRNSRRFGFLELTGEALKRILGLGEEAGGSRGQHKCADSRATSGSLSLTLAKGGAIHLETASFQLNSNNFGGHKSANKVTAIDSGEDYYFKRKVFKYQLLILRLISLLSAALVLLSPVAMLLVPKMESIFRGHEFANADQSEQQPPVAQSQAQAQAPSVTHAVGLSGPSRQLPHQSSAPSYFLSAQPQWRISECSSDCDGPLLGFVWRLILLCVAYWAIFFRAQTATLPRVDFHRCLLSSTALLLTTAYWLFFLFRLFDKRHLDFELQYMTIVQFACSMLESLILLHYLAVILLELRQRKKVYCLKVVRSPDGASQYYSCGSLSIQKCAQFVLEKYHRNFAQYGPYAEQLAKLEDQLAEQLTSGGGERPAAEQAPRSRAQSPANSTSGARSSSRRLRHRSAARSSARAANRSPSESPQRHPSAGNGSRSRRRTSNEASGRLHQVDAQPPAPTTAAASEEQEPTGAKSNSDENKTESAANNQQPGEQNDSADQSSDATSRMKESSLDTIRAANSSSDLLSQQQRAAAATESGKSPELSRRQQSRGDKARAGSGDWQQQAATKNERDDVESVRSVRSRRSTSRSHHRHKTQESHQSSRRERSSSRTNHHNNHETIVQMNSDPLEEHERKLRRRKYRLLLAVQDSFEQIKQVDSVEGNNETASCVGGTNSEHQQQQQATSSAKQALGPSQAARSLYPSIARPLQKYLRLTKQTGRHNLQSIHEHLSKCLLYKLSARAFIEKFVNQDPVWQSSETNLFADCKLMDSTLVTPQQKSHDLEINSWSLVCDTLLSRQIDSGTFFVLRQGQVSLLVTVAKLPHLSLKEEVIDQKSCKFSLGPNSETSV